MTPGYSAKLLPGPFKFWGLLVLLGILAGATARTQAGVTLGHLAADTDWTYSTQGFAQSTTFSAATDPTATYVTASMPLFQKVEGDLSSAANFAANVAESVTNVTATSFDVAFTGSATSDSSNVGSHALYTFAQGEVQLPFITDVPITINLSLTANPTMASSNLSGTTSAASAASVEIYGFSNGGQDIQAGLFSGQFLQTTAGSSSQSNLNETYSFYHVISPAYSLSRVDGATSTSIQLQPGSYVLFSEAVATTEFDSANGTGAPYGSGSFPDPTMSAQTHAGPAAGPAVVPEPSSLALFMMGLAMAGGWRRGRRRT